VIFQNRIESFKVLLALRSVNIRVNDNALATNANEFLSLSKGNTTSTESLRDGGVVET
jgi:hypothetical protein